METQPQSDYLFLLSVSLIALGLALFIVFHAYRGYQRNESPRMLFLAGGLCLITVVPLGISIGVNSVGQVVGFHSRVYTFYAPTVARVSEVVGLCSLLYSLLITPGRSKT
jgi:hypothetical protein